MAAAEGFTRAEMPVSAGCSHKEIIVQNSALIVKSAVNAVPLAVLHFYVIPSVTSAVRIAHSYYARYSGFVTEDFKRLAVTLTHGFVRVKNTLVGSCAVGISNFSSYSTRLQIKSCMNFTFS